MWREGGAGAHEGGIYVKLIDAINRLRGKMDIFGKITHDEKSGGEEKIGGSVSLRN